MNTYKYLEFIVDPRYWEDGFVNDTQDNEGTIPLREGESWHIVIEIESGLVIGWPKGIHAEVCYKVCDAGEYWLLNDKKERILKWHSGYAPFSFFKETDYIRLNINGNGIIEDWSPNDIQIEKWN